MKRFLTLFRVLALLAIFFASISFALVSPLRLVYAPSTPATVTEYAIPTPTSLPTGLTLDPSGNSVWFVEFSGNKLARLDPVANTIQEWMIPTPNSQTTGLAATTIGGSTAVFGVEFNTNKVFIFFSSTNTFREYTLPTPNSGPEYISVEPPSTLIHAWFSEIGTSGTRNALGELVYDTGSNTATLNEMTLPVGAGGGANGVYAGPGIVWLAGYTSIVKWDEASNQFSTWPIPSHPSTTAAFVAPASASVGQIWYTSRSSGSSSPDNYVGLLRGDNTFEEWQIPTLGADARVVSVSATTKNPWVAEEGASKITQLDPSSGGTVSGGGAPTVTPFAPVLGALVATPPSPAGSSLVAVTPAPNSNTGVLSGQFTEWTIAASAPHDVAVDNAGNTWVAESGSNKIAKLAISTPDFSLSPSAPTLTIPQGGSGSVTITGASVFGFTGAVTLAVTGSVPTGVTSSFNPNPISIPSGSSAQSTLTLNVASSATPGSSLITVTGTGAGTHVTTFTLAISTGPDFTVAATPNSLTVTQGTTVTSTINVGSTNGFSSPVALSYSWISAPSGVTVSLPGPVTPPSGSSATSTLTVTASPTASTGSYTLSVTGTSGPLIHPVSLAIQVTAAATTSTTASTPTTASTTSTSTPTSTSTSVPGPQCLIATATFGSELSPEVQLLRNLRDNAILRTQAGSSFMIVFNTWYYSFSPYVANYLTDHGAERTVMKGALYPLIGIIWLSSVTFAVTSASPELAVLLTGLVASSLIGAFYIGIPLGVVRARTHRLSAKRAAMLTQAIGITLLAGIIALVIGEAATSQVMLMVSSSTIVLSTLTLSSITTSSFLSRRIASPNQ